MNDAWAVLFAGLGGSGLTGLGALGVEWYRSKRAEEAERRNRLREACADLNAHAVTLALRAAVLTTTAASQTGLPYSLNVLTHTARPLDGITIGEWLVVEQGAMLKAQAIIDVLADEELIKAGADVIDKANRIVSAAGDIEKYRREHVRAAQKENPLAGLTALFSRYQIGPEQEGEMQRGARELGRTTRHFARLIRSKLNIPVPDSVIDAYPELFQEDDEKPPEEPTSS